MIKIDIAKHIIRIFLFITPTLISAQDDFIVHGKIARVTKSDSIILGSSWGTFAGIINDNGTFVIKGKGIKEAGDALIYTDSSNANSIWLEPGEYNMECKEIKLEISSRPIFRIPLLKGPKDAEINHGLKEQFFEFSSVPQEKRKQVARSFTIAYIDSI